MLATTDIKYSLDFLRPVRTEEAFEAVTLLPQCLLMSAGQVTSFWWSQQPSSCW